jgi:GH15 family glucan-1,4-alpha-glucosidase
VSSHLPLPDAIDPATALAETAAFWTGWTKLHAGTGASDAAVNRSLITLKALAYLPTGGIVAAPTTSLAERLGGARNWDYRSCWLCDSTLTLLAFMNADYYDEAKS